MCTFDHFIPKYWSIYAHPSIFATERYYNYGIYGYNTMAVVTKYNDLKLLYF